MLNIVYTIISVSFYIFYLFLKITINSKNGLVKPFFSVHNNRCFKIKKKCLKILHFFVDKDIYFGIIIVLSLKRQGKLTLILDSNYHESDRKEKNFYANYWTIST